MLRDLSGWGSVRLVSTASLTSLQHMSYFTDWCNKVPEKGNAWKERFILAPRSREMFHKGVRSLRQLVTVQAGCKETNVGVQFTLPLHSVWTPRAWNVLWLSVDLIMLVYWVILDPVRLVIISTHAVLCYSISEWEVLYMLWMTRAAHLVLDLLKPAKQ